MSRRLIHCTSVPRRWVPLFFAKFVQCMSSLLAQICRCWSGRACLLCPGISDVDLFRYCEGIIYLNAEVSDGAFNLGVAEQELHGP